MPKTAAERMAETRARRRGELPPLPTCKVCGRTIKDSDAKRSMAAGLCHAHWAESTEGSEFLKEQRRIRREKQTGPRPYRYFGALPGEESYPEGPFNRMRLAVSSTYAGKNKPRGVLFIVWSDGIVTEHAGVRQVDVGAISRDDGEIVDRDDLTSLATDMPAMTERCRHYGKGDTLLV